MGTLTRPRDKTPGILVCMLSVTVLSTGSTAFKCFYGNLNNKTLIQTCIKAVPPAHCFSTTECQTPGDICFTQGRLAPATDEFVYYSGCSSTVDCQTEKGSQNDCTLGGFLAALVFNSDFSCGTCCDDAYYCNDLGVLSFLIPKTTNSAVTLGKPTTVMARHRQTTDKSPIETTRQVETGEEKQSTVFPTTDYTTEFPRPVSTSATPFATTHAVEERQSTLVLVDDDTSHQFISTNMLSPTDTTLTKKNFEELATTYQSEDSTESNDLETSTGSFMETNKLNVQGAHPNEHTLSTEATLPTVTTATHDHLRNASVHLRTENDSLKISTDYENYCNTTDEAIFGVTRRGLHGLNVFFSRLDNTPPCIYGEIQHEQPSANFPVCANACLMSNSCKFLSFNRLREVCTIFYFP